MEELQALIDKVKNNSENVGLSPNMKKTEVVKILYEDANDNSNIHINSNPLENVNQLTYLGAVISINFDDTLEIKRRLTIANNATVALATIWTDRAIFLGTKIRILQFNDLYCHLWQ